MEEHRAAASGVSTGFTGAGGAAAAPGGGVIIGDDVGAPCSYGAYQLACALGRAAPATPPEDWITRLRASPAAFGSKYTRSLGASTKLWQVNLQVSRSVGERNA
jgi:hypothetical protein